METRIELSEHLYDVLIETPKITGSYDPKENLHLVQEHLTQEEVKNLESFWNYIVSKKLTYGSGNVYKIWNEWYESDIK